MPDTGLLGTWRWAVRYKVISLFNQSKYNYTLRNMYTQICHSFNLPFLFLINHLHNSFYNIYLHHKRRSQFKHLSSQESTICEATLRGPVSSCSAGAWGSRMKTEGTETQTETVESWYHMVLSHCCHQAELNRDKICTGHPRYYNRHLN